MSPVCDAQASCQRRRHRPTCPCASAPGRRSWKRSAPGPRRSPARPAAGSAALPDGYMEDDAAGAGDYTDGDVDDADDAYDDRGADLAPPPATGSAERAQRACATDPGAHMAAPNPVKSVRNLRLVPWSPQNQTLTAPDPSHAGTTLTWLLSLLSPLKTSAS